MFTGNLVSTILIAVSAIVIARLLGPGAYGTYTLALLLPNILLYLIGLGVSVGLTRFSAQCIAKGERSEAQRMTRNGLVFLIIFGAFLTAVSFAGSSYVSTMILHRPSLVGLARVASLAVFSQGIVLSVTSALLGWNAMRTISIVNVSQAAIKLITATALVVIGFGAFGALLGLIASYFTAGAIALLSLYIVARGAGSHENGLRVFLSDNATMLRYGFPHQVGNLVSGLALQYVTVVLALVGTNVVVGYYQSAYNVLSAVSLTSSAVSLTLFPAFAHLEGIQADTTLAFSYAVKYTSLLIGPLVIFLIGASGPIMQILYGSSFTSADIYLVLLCLSNLPILVGFPIFPSFFSGVGRTNLSMYFFFFGAGLQFLLAPLLGILLDLGVPGLILSILISNLGATGLGLYLAKRSFHVGLDAKALLATLSASVLALLALLPFQALSSSPLLLLIADIAVFSLVYLTSAPLVGAVSKDDVIRLSIATSGLGLFSIFITIILGYERQVLRVKLGVTDMIRAG